MQQRVGAWEAERAAGVIQGERVWSGDVADGARVPVRLQGEGSGLVEIPALVDIGAQVSVVISRVVLVEGGWKILATKLRNLIGVGQPGQNLRGVLGVVRVRTCVQDVDGVVTYAVVDSLSDILPGVVVGA